MNAIPKKKSKSKAAKKLKKQRRRTTVPNSNNAPRASRRTTDPKHLPRTVTALLLRNKDGNYDPKNDPNAPLHIQLGETPEWTYQDGTGTPPTYDELYHPMAAVQLMAEGAAPIELALEFGVFPATVYRWMKEHEPFRFAVEHGRVLTKAWWVREGRQQLDSRTFNNGLYALHMSNRFGWSKKNEMSILGAPGALMPTDEVLPKELQAEVYDPNEDEAIDVNNQLDSGGETIDVGRSAEILQILISSGALVELEEGESK